MLSSLLTLLSLLPGGPSPAVLSARQQRAVAARMVLSDRATTSAADAKIFDVAVGEGPATPACEPAAPLSVIVAGGGIGGLCAALVLKNQGFDVRVFEKTTQYRPFGGPIQIASNALESLLRIDEGVYAQIMEKSTTIGDRKNGLKDGISNEWFATFDLLGPAQARNQDASVVIDRPELQDILLSKVSDCVTTGAEVVGYEVAPRGQGVTCLLSDGTRHDADLLVGAEGIRSKVRNVMLREDNKPPVWSGYTCFAAIAQCVPDDIAEVGYKVWLGSRKYFVSVDVGGGRIQWYAALHVPPGSPHACARMRILMCMACALHACAGTPSSTCRPARSPAPSRRARASSSTCAPSLAGGARRCTS